MAKFQQDIGEALRRGHEAMAIASEHGGGRRSTIEQIAADIAPELGRLLHEWLSSDMILGTKEHADLERFLWDNKVGMLRVCEAVVSIKGEYST